MIQTSEKLVQAVAPASASGAAFASTVVDTVGFRSLRFLASFGSIGANVAAMKVQESETLTNITTLANGADVAATVVGTDTNGGATALPAATTDSGKTWIFEIDLRGRKRYQQLQVTAGAGATLLSAVALLGRAERSPNTAAEKGAAAVMRHPKL